MSTLFGILSGFGKPERRQAVIDTWAGDLLPGDDLVFIVGDPTSPDVVRAGHLLIGPAPDDYQHLTHKVYWFFRWASLNSRQKFIFKCDDDTYLRPERMPHLPRGDYVGYRICHQQHEICYASGGAGYRIPGDLLPELANRLRTTMARRPDIASIEDMTVGLTLAEMEIRLTHVNQFSPNSKVVPRVDNQQLTAHWCTPQRLHEIHDPFKHRKPWKAS